MTPSPKNNANVTASPLSSPTHHQLQAESPSTPNTSSAFQIRKQSIVNATSNDSTNQNQSNQPQVAQTTTLNLHGINFSSLQGAMAQYPRLQNVQVHQISLDFRLSILILTEKKSVCSVSLWNCVILTVQIFSGSNSWACSTNFIVTNWNSSQFGSYGYFTPTRSTTR